MSCVTGCMRVFVFLYFKDKGLCLYIHKQIMYLAILITIQNQISNYCSVCMSSSVLKSLTEGESTIDWGNEFKLLC